VSFMRRGYLFLLAGILIGFLAFSVVSFLYSGVRSQGGTGGIPTKIEFDLMEILPEREWQPFSFIVIRHGREVCKARKPRCEICILEKYCPSSTLASA